MSEATAPDDAMLREFLVDAREALDALDQNIVGIERNPADREAVDNVFRSLHSLKGVAGFLEFSRLESVAHAGENLLQGVRDGRVPVDDSTIDVLLAVLDAMRAIIGGIERDGREPEMDTRTLVERLTHALDRSTPSASPSAPPSPSLASSSPSSPSSPSPSPLPPEEAAPDTVRVDVTVLDEIMDRVGELVLSRNQILQITTARADAELQRSAQQLDRITSDLQERVMKTRMQPIKNVWSRLPRIVRDLSHALGKEVRVEMVGKETELDRTLIDAIKDPLAHLVRNAVDHGIELPAERVRKGKPAEGTFTLQAYHESGQVVIEVSDDGAGIDPERVKAKAVEKGVIAAAEAASMSRKEAVAIIFRPGFSTVDQVTNISGRGVGMDVVRSNIERLGGSIDVDSTVGVGTRFRIKIPLTLAIIPALMVTCSGASFAIPQVNVVELVRVRATEGAGGVENVRGSAATRLRGRLLPLVDLAALLAGRDALSPAAIEAKRRAGQAALSTVVLQANERLFGLVVDGIEESQEIVVKPLGSQVQDVPVYAGATILGDGRVALILDTLGLAQSSGLLAAERMFQREETTAAATTSETRSVLLVQDAGGGRFAIPLGAIARLEKVPQGRIERVGDRELMQYGEDILSLVRIDRVTRSPAPTTASGTSEHFYVVVLGERDVPVGVVADKVLDVAEAEIAQIKPAMRPGVTGTAVVRGKVTEFLDIDEVKRAARPQEAIAHV